MRIDVTVHRSGGTQALYKARIEQVAGIAAKLVTQELGGSMPHTRIVLTDGKGLVKLKERCEKDVAAEGDEKLARRLSGGTWEFGATKYHGATVLDSRGPVLLINGPQQRDLRDLDETLVHELVHCLQAACPDKRERYTAYVRKVYRGEKSDAARAYLKLMDRDERDAIKLERLAPKLPGWKGDEAR
jgi:hypothetical protein